MAGSAQPKSRLALSVKVLVALAAALAAFLIDGIGPCRALQHLSYNALPPRAERFKSGFSAKEFGLSIKNQMPRVTRASTHVALGSTSSFPAVATGVTAVVVSIRTSALREPRNLWLR